MLSATGLMGVIGAIILGLVMAYGINRNKNRSQRNAAIGDAAAREQYRHPNSYNPQEFRERLSPNPDGSTPRKN